MSALWGLRLIHRGLALAVRSPLWGVSRGHKKGDCLFRLMCEEKPNKQSHQQDYGAVPCLVDTLTPAQNGPENARNHHGEEHLHR